MTARRRAALWSPEAVADLDAIWDYYARVAGRDTTDSFVDEIDDVVGTIEAHLLAERSRDEIRHGIRSSAVSPHVVFYCIADDRPRSSASSTAAADELFADESG